MRVLQKTANRAAPGFSLNRYLRNVDWMLLLASLALTGYGLVMIYSATHADPNLPSPTYYVRSQLVGLGLGLVLLVVISLVDFVRLRRWRHYVYLAGIFLLIMTLLLGEERMGGRRWLPLPFFDIQTSELAKFLVIVAFAGFLAEGVELRHRFRFVILAICYVGLPALLVSFQPDLGTAIVFVFLLFCMLLVWGIRWSHLALLLTALAAVAITVLRVLPTTFGVHVLKQYQLERLLVFLDPERDPSGPGYQLFQSKIAVASGLLRGKGLTEGTQSHLNFLPAHHTDFIFAVLGEELGFLGAALLLALYLVVLWRMFRIATIARNLYGTLLATGAAATLLFQVFVNIGMTIGLVPVTGVPLPFMSSGSSSLVVFLMLVGLLQSVHIHSRTALYGGRIKGELNGQVAAQP